MNASPTSPGRRSVVVHGQTGERVVSVVRAPRGHDPAAGPCLFDPCPRNGTNGRGADHPVVGCVARISPWCRRPSRPRVSNQPEPAERGRRQPRPPRPTRHGPAPRPVPTAMPRSSRSGADLQDPLPGIDVHGVEHGRHSDGWLLELDGRNPVLPGSVAPSSACVTIGSSAATSACHRASSSSREVDVNPAAASTQTTDGMNCARGTSSRSCQSVTIAVAPYFFSSPSCFVGVPLP